MKKQTFKKQNVLNKKKLLINTSLLLLSFGSLCISLYEATRLLFFKASTEFYIILYGIPEKVSMEIKTLPLAILLIIIIVTYGLSSYFFTSVITGE